jgi:hypothetical protein
MDVMTVLSIYWLKKAYYFLNISADNGLKEFHWNIIKFEFPTKLRVT